MTWACVSIVIESVLSSDSPSVRARRNAHPRGAAVGGEVDALAVARAANAEAVQAVGLALAEGGAHAELAGAAQRLGDRNLLRAPQQRVDAPERSVDAA